jgi:TolB-like protein/Flp pilus assembly protein TadD
VAVAPSALTDALHDRFSIERELGRGGMGLVWLARDLRHNRQVALKVIRPELASVVGAERFGREIQLAAQLQHPNIVPVYESGQCEGTLYYVMPYVEGESLRARLRLEAQLPLEEALQIAGEVADALAYAHAHGVVHRDIKPENILLANGHALVVDFGIARAITVAGTDRLTETGLVIGTPAYMSPEQSSGSQALDGRTDLYSLACVVYEMLAGEPPYTGPSSQAIIAKRFTEPIPHLRTVREEIPARVEQAVTRALAKVPADRFATATEFARALQSDSAATLVAPRATAWAGRRFPLAMLTLALGFAIGLGALFAWRRSHSVSEATPKRLAVLPFENLGDSADGYFADGMTEAVRGKLTALPGLEVIASTSSNQYRHTTKSPRQIGQELGVDYLLVGRVRWAKGPGRESRIQVSPELVEVGSAADKWQQPFDAALTDVFQVQADVAAQVAQALGVTLSGSARAALAARPTQNLAAYDSLLRGDRLLITEGRLGEESVRAAVSAYSAAVRLDSTFALGWARLAWAESYRYDGADSDEGADSIAEIAKQAADRALALDPQLAQTYNAIALVRTAIYRDGRGAISALERARKLAPHDVDILTQLAGHLGDVLGRWDEAVALCAEAARLDPRSPLVARRYVTVLIKAGRAETADSVGTAALEIVPDNFLLLNMMVLAHVVRGDVPGARALLRGTLAHVPVRQFVTHVRNPIGDDGWVWLMDDSIRALALGLPPRAFGEDRAQGLLHVAGINWAVGRYAVARVYADSARPLLEKQLTERPRGQEQLWALALTYAYLGRCAEALQRERERVLLFPKPTHPSVFNSLFLAVRCGDYASAVAWADTLIHAPKSFSAAWFRVSPDLAPLRGRPDFERLVAGK